MNSKKFIHKIRLESARQYLLETNYSLRDIAMMVGYQSYNGFYRMFVSKMGMTPQEYRKKHENKL